MDLYVYYKVPAEHVQALHARVANMQAQLARDYGVATSLKRRPQEKDAQQTWMEVYIAVMEDFELILERAVVEAGLSSLIDGERHIELFWDITACA